MVGDSYALDIEPATRLGMLGALKTNGRTDVTRDDDGGVHYIDTLAELVFLPCLQSCRRQTRFETGGSDVDNDVPAKTSTVRRVDGGLYLGGRDPG